MEAAYTFSFLKEQNIPDLYDTFLAAFADYVVPIKMTREEFAIKFKREGVEPTFCAGVFHNHKLVGFILTGLGEWQGKPTAYNAGTGVLPAHRGNRLTQRLYEFLLPKLRESGIEQCLLEVIDQNQVAIKAYEAVGFETTRTLDCFRSPKQNLLLTGEEPKDITIRKTMRPNWEAYAEFCDIGPSWQNTKHAFRKSPDKKVTLEAYFEENLLVGYVAFFPKTGSIAQLGVLQNYRNIGVATALLREVVGQTEAPALMATNIDTTCRIMLEFFERSHFNRILSQYEMLLRLY
ncbi:GNAT family N-acetyltransferase [Pontibacter sp. JH31]|uniref:GNAT family N-acetyltransferase n=1 Tax=Pontibacter aquaedesilientis TaxID=2766980 RepID=A0ABR7XJA6_9BACT|nr:GNAT family N-acetyltransferase [Pontibacter aquaedesilientis]MBD1398333.1 GNAT family N-acetyltransferase [Pontibacter aquaedesilientis]